MQLMGYLMDPEKDNTPLLVGAFILLAAQIQFVVTNALLLEGIETGYFVVMGVLYALFYIGFGVVKIFQPVYEDEIYILMSVTSKLSLSWILIGNIFEGFKELDERTDPDFTDLDWRGIQWAIVAFSAIGLVVGIPLINSLKPAKDSKDALRKAEQQVSVLKDKGFKDLRY